MRIDEILQRSQDPVFSFEFFPPKTDEGMANLFEAASKLRELEPSFVSVTYGAGGSTRARTIEIVKRIKNELGLEAMAHFTCVGATVEDLHDVLSDMRSAGIENVLALRGDPPQGEEQFTRPEGGLGYANELTELIVQNYDFSVGGACYPETHVEAPGAERDLTNLRLKVAAGTRFLITQLFFDNDAYFDFVERARTEGIGLPIIPGIMPITNVEQIKRFTKMCGATIPERLRQELESRAGDAEAVVELGVAYATLQCADLLARGAPGIHFYTLNRSPAARAILSALRAARPWARAQRGPALEQA